MVRPYRLGYIMLDTPDLDAATKFWTNIWALEISERTENRVYLRGGPQHHWIVLQKAEKPGLARWSMEVSTVEELEALEKRLREEGIKVETGDGLESDRIGPYVRFHDPSGNPLELYVDMLTMPNLPERPFPILDIQHSVLYVEHLPTSYDFYHGVLGMGLSERLANAIAFVHMGNGWHHGIGLGAGPAKQGMNHVCFHSPDLAATMKLRELVLKNGLTISMDFLKHAPSTSEGFYFVGHDGIVTEFSYGSRNMKDPGERVRLMDTRPNTLDLWKSWLAGPDELDMVERLREQGVSVGVDLDRISAVGSIVNTQQ
ncbi:MAG TPA: VOC family protein [Dehalococcoidia bacterium]|nr:VOC family protein [Dehalococcoidia bacterium]